VILCDAGPLVALIDRRQQRHLVCKRALERIQVPLITTWPCFTEAMHLLDRLGSWPFQELLWQMYTAGIVVVRSPNLAEETRMRDLMLQYRDMPMDLADASLVAAAEELKSRRVFTLDKHFLAYRTADGRAMEIVPA
jgi:uncharacterized protein